MGKIKCVIADDHTLLRELLCRLSEGEDCLECVGVSYTGKKAIETPAKNSPDIVLIDIEMPDMDGIEATRKIKSSFPNKEQTDIIKES